MANFLRKNSFNFQIFPRVGHFYLGGFFTESQHSYFITLASCPSQKVQSLHHGWELPSHFKFFPTWNDKIPKHASISLYLFPNLTDWESTRDFLVKAGEEHSVRLLGLFCSGVTGVPSRRKLPKRNHIVASKLGKRMIHIYVGRAFFPPPQALPHNTYTSPVSQHCPRAGLRARGHLSSDSRLALCSKIPSPFFFVIGVLVCNASPNNDHGSWGKMLCCTWDGCWYRLSHQSTILNQASWGHQAQGKPVPVPGHAL